VLFGATGDLSQRMLLPSLYGLDMEGLLPAHLAIVATSRSDLDDEAFRNLSRAALERSIESDRLPGAAVDRFLGRLRYVSVDATESDRFAPLAERAMSDGQELGIFLSTAPTLFAATISGLRSAGLTGPNVRLALEKPLGHDLRSSRAINDAVATAFPEQRTFRIDHYLGKEAVQNLLALRFGNALFEPTWNSHGIDHVQITVAETVGLENRTAYFDDAGSLRDMVQNHMLQLLALVAMEPPARFDSTDIRDEKVKVLRALRPIGPEACRSQTVVGQYAQGAIAGVPVSGYLEDLGRPSETETFVAIKAHVDNWRWKGVPFYLRTGKRLPVRVSEIAIQFKAVPHSIFADRGAMLQPNKLVIRLQPEREHQPADDGQAARAGPGRASGSARCRSTSHPERLRRPAAPHRLRAAAARLRGGDPTLFVRRDEVEAQWEWIDTIRDGWLANGMQPKPYAAGTWGPSSSIALTERDGVSWRE
jgi:glucose-6-phosphate 1-dehydrogenase